MYIITEVPFFGVLSVSEASTFFPSLCARLRFNGGSPSPPTEGTQFKSSSQPSARSRNTSKNRQCSNTYDVSFLHLYGVYIHWLPYNSILEQE